LERFSRKHFSKCCLEQPAARNVFLKRFHSYRRCRTSSSEVVSGAGGTDGPLLTSPGRCFCLTLVTQLTRRRLRSARHIITTRPVSAIPAPVPGITTFPFTIRRHKDFSPPFEKKHVVRVILDKKRHRKKTQKSKHRETQVLYGDIYQKPLF